MDKVFEALEKLEECANGMKDLPKSNWCDLAENEAELDLKDISVKNLHKMNLIL